MLKSQEPTGPVATSFRRLVNDVPSLEAARPVVNGLNDAQAALVELLVSLLTASLMPLMMAEIFPEEL